MNSEFNKNNSATHSLIDSQATAKPLVASEFDTSLRWLEIAAGTTFLIGIAGLLAIMSHGAWAADSAPATKPGFATGAKAFSNPFGNQNNTNDEDDDLDFGDEAPKNGANRGNSAGNAAAAAPTSGFGSVSNSIRNSQANAAAAPLSMGGGPSNGVISQGDVAAAQVNNETGEGTKEMVTDFNFPDADIMDIAKTLGKLTGKNFIFDKDVKGRISIISNSPISVGDAWRAFLTSLDMSGFALIPSGKYLRIARNRDARDKQLKTYTGNYNPNTDALITRIFSLKYINADEVARTFRTFMPANSRIMSYDQTNTVIVTDTGANISKLGSMLEILDVEGYDSGIEVLQVKYASAVELAKLIDQLIPGTGAGGAAGQPRFGGNSFGGSHFSARKTKEGGVINTIIADERTNEMIINANTKGFEQVRTLVTKLDQKVPVSTGGGKVHVVYLQFAEAEAIATTLNNLSSSAGGAGGFKPPGSAGGTGVNPTSASLFEGSIKVSADKATNSLVVTASPMDFSTVNRVINRLDIPRDEVYVEVIIMEVAIGSSTNYSANIISIPSGLGTVTNSTDLTNFLTNPTALGGGILGFAGGHQTSISVGGTSTPIASLTGLIHFIEGNTKSNVLATPQIIALDNTEAFFEQADNIPVASNTTTATGIVNAGSTTQKVALSIKIKPQINKISNFVKMDVEAKLGDVQQSLVPSALQNTAIATQDRTAKTTVVVADTDTVVLGGLIRDNVSDTVSKIPILGDIPILGWLFKSDQKTSQKTNLLIFLTPHIVRQYEKVRAILDQKLKERDEFIETNAGGDDLVRRQRDAIIRSLPDINSVSVNPPTSAVTIDEENPEKSGDGNPFTGGNNIKGNPVKEQSGKGLPMTPPPADATLPPAVPLPGAVEAPQGSVSPGEVAPPPPVTNNGG